MAARNPPLYLQAGSHPATNDRLLLEALLAPPPAPVSGAGYGIVAPGDLAVTENGTPNMSVNVAAGKVFIDGTENAVQGAYLAVNDATVNLAIAASNPTNPRKDLVVAKVQDAEWSGATNSWSLAVVTGTPAASPAEPAIPANAVVLAMIDIPAADTAITNSQITDRRRRASALGGIVVCTSTTRPTSGLYEGLFIYETDTDKLLGYDGSGWVTAAALGAFPSYTPTLTQSGAVAKTLTYTKYTQRGKAVEGTAYMTVTGTGTASNAVKIGLPVPAATVAATIIGTGYILDSSANLLYTGLLTVLNSNEAQLLANVNGAAVQVLGAASFTAALDANDLVNVKFAYEAT